MKSIAEVMCSDLFGSADYVLIIYSIVRKPDPVIKLHKLAYLIKTNYHAAWFGTEL